MEGTADLGLQLGDLAAPVTPPAGQLPDTLKNSLREGLKCTHLGKQGAGA